MTSVRREVFREQEVLAFDFEPRKDFKPKNLAEKVVNKMAGTIFVDENEKEIVRLEARLIDNVKIGGGLFASLASASYFIAEQEKVRNEVWLPSYEEVVLSAKAFLLLKFKANIVIHYNDYKKYQTDVKIGEGEEVSN